MFQTVKFNSICPEPPGSFTDSLFLETAVPIVWMYLSSKLSRTNGERTSDFSLDFSPTTQILAFIRGDRYLPVRRSRQETQSAVSRRPASKAPSFSGSGKSER